VEPRRHPSLGTEEGLVLLSKLIHAATGYKYNPALLLLHGHRYLSKMAFPSCCNPSVSVSSRPGRGL
jgi:hypothetical protein